MGIRVALEMMCRRAVECARMARSDWRRSTAINSRHDNNALFDRTNGNPVRAHVLRSLISIFAALSLSPHFSSCLDSHRARTHTFLPCFEPETKMMNRILLLTFAAALLLLTAAVSCQNAKKNVAELSDADLELSLIHI